MMMNLYGKLGGVLLGGGAVIGLMIGAYFLGSNHGKASVNEKWNLERLQYANQTLEFETALAFKEKEHVRVSGQLVMALEQMSKEHEIAISNINAEFNSRLHASEKRASVYRSQAEAGPIESANLASHAADLDRTLEQGRQLVKEFSANIGQCESRIDILGKQILADREAIGE